MSSSAYFGFWRSPVSSAPPIPLLVKKLLETENSEKALGLLKYLYGERIIDEVLQRYKFNDPITPEKIQIIMGAISARVTWDDLKHLHTALQNLELASKEEEPFLFLLTKEELTHLIVLAKRTSFEEIDDEGLEQMLNVFRTELGTNGEHFPLAMPTKNALEGIDLSPKATKHFHQDKILLERIQQLAEFDCNAALRINGEKIELSENSLVVDVEGLALSEYMSRSLAYASLRKGMIVPVPTKSQKPTYFKVEGSIEKNGFAYFLLSKINSEGPKKFHVLFRGTDPGDIASVSHCFGKSVGLKPFSENARKILDNLKSTLALHADTSIEFNGHSQGGSLAQHGLDIVLKEINASDSPLKSAKHIRVVVWNSPSVLEKEAQDIADNLEALAKNPQTMNTKVDFAYNIIDKDIVHNFGERLAGFILESFNANRQIIRFEATKPGLLGHHCSPILMKNGEPVIVGVHTERREQINQRLKTMIYLDVLIKHLAIDSDNNPDDHPNEISLLENIEADLGDAFTLQMNTMDVIDLKILREHLAEQFDKDVVLLKKHSEEITQAMLLSTYKNLSQLDQYTGGAIVEVAKSSLYDMVNPQVSTKDKVKNAAIFGAGAGVGTVALYGLGAFAATNPVTAAVVVTGAGLAVGTYKAVNKIKEVILG